jgi:hypothetical protein
MPRKAVKPPTPVIEPSSRQRKWNEMFARLVAYRDQHGDCLVPRFYDVVSPTLGHWVANRRVKYKHGRLTPDQIQLLTDIGFEWSPQSNALCRRGHPLDGVARSRGGQGRSCRICKQQRKLQEGRVRRIPGYVYGSILGPLPAKTHCKHGHPLDGLRSNGRRGMKRYCTTCRSGGATRTHCRNGHAYTKPMVLDRRGRRMCTVCRPPRGPLGKKTYNPKYYIENRERLLAQGQ